MDQICIICRTETGEMRKCIKCTAYYCFDCILQYLSNQIQNKTNFECCQCKSKFEINSSNGDLISLSKHELSTIDFVLFRNDQITHNYREINNSPIDLPSVVCNTPIYSNLRFYRKDNGTLRTIDDQYRLCVFINQFYDGGEDTVDLCGYRDNIISDIDLYGFRFGSYLYTSHEINLSYDELLNIVTIGYQVFYNQSIDTFDDISFWERRIFLYRLTYTIGDEKCKMIDYSNKLTNYSDFRCKKCRSIFSKRCMRIKPKSIDDIPNYQNHINSIKHKTKLYVNQLHLEKQQSKELKNKHKQTTKDVDSEEELSLAINKLMGYQTI